MVIAALAAGVCFFSWLYHRDMLALRGWAIGLAMGAVGSLLISARTPASAIALAVAGKTLPVAGYVAVWASVRQFNRGLFDRRLAAGIILLFGLSFAAACLAGADMRERALMVSPVIALICFSSTREVLKVRPPESLASRVPTAIAFAVIGLALTIRTAVTLVSDAPMADAPFYDATQGSTSFAHAIGIVGANSAF
jgi:hypothetical protein